jgi:site-specific DNA-methyltransferase (adenine-specific)
VIKFEFRYLYIIKYNNISYSIIFHKEKNMNDENNQIENKDLQLWQGDCLELMKNIPDKSINLILADLPYKQLASKWDKPINLVLLWEQYKRILSPKGTVALFGQQPFTTDLITSNRKNYKYCWYWEKNQSTHFLHAKRQPLRKIEEIVVFYNGSYYPQKTDGHIPTNSARGKTYGGAYLGENKRDYQGGDTTRYPINLLTYKCVDNYNRLHTSQKPVELLKFLIKSYTLEGDVVLDNAMGSGSTGIASLDLKRKFIGIEMDENIFEIAKKRMEQINEH